MFQFLALLLHIVQFVVIFYLFFIRFLYLLGVCWFVIAPLVSASVFLPFLGAFFEKITYYFKKANFR